MHVDFSIDTSAFYVDNGDYFEGQMSGLVFVPAEGKNWLNDCSTKWGSYPERSQGELRIVSDLSTGVYRLYTRDVSPLPHAPGDGILRE